MAKNSSIIFLFFIKIHISLFLSIEYVEKFILHINKYFSSTNIAFACILYFGNTKIFIQAFFSFIVFSSSVAVFGIIISILIFFSFFIFINLFTNSSSFRY
ncbi:hypothetical protein HOA93_06925 [bacterium]|nr:hypothetical protein [bacterium]